MTRDTQKPPSELAQAGTSIDDAFIWDGTEYTPQAQTGGSAYYPSQTNA